MLDNAVHFGQSALVKAQEVFMEMIRYQVGPRLRELGLKGGGRSWEYPNDSFFILLGFQGSQFNRATAAKYTINLGVCRRDTWTEVRAYRPYLPLKPKPNVSYGTFGWWKRIGQVMPEQQDRWW